MKIYKILIAVFGAIAVLCITLAFTLSGCEKKTETAEPESQSDKIVKEAIEVLKDCWKKQYDLVEGKSKPGFRNFDDRHVEIINTRIIHINDEFDDSRNESMFGDIECIVEFELFTNYFGSTPYYSDFNTHDRVHLKKDGTMEMAGDHFAMYSSKTFIYDYSDIIESIDNLHGKYDQVLKLN